MSIRIIPQVRSQGDKKKKLLGCKTYGKTFSELSLGVAVVGGVQVMDFFYFILSVSKGF